MKALGVIVNIFLPGIGTLIVGKVGQCIAQLLLYVLGVIINFTVVGMVIGIPLCVAVWIWAIASAASSNPRPMQVELIHRDGRQGDAYLTDARR